MSDRFDFSELSKTDAFPQRKKTEKEIVKEVNQREMFKEKFPFKILPCNDPNLPPFVQNKIVEFQELGKTCKGIKYVPGNVFSMTTTAGETFVIQPESLGGKKTRKRNKKYNCKKKNNKTNKKYKKNKRKPNKIYKKNTKKIKKNN